jgi:hypothetical protein
VAADRNLSEVRARTGLRAEKYNSTHEPSQWSDMYRKDVIITTASASDFSLDIVSHFSSISSLMTGLPWRSARTRSFYNANA